MIYWNGLYTNKRINNNVQFFYQIVLCKYICMCPGVLIWKQAQISAEGCEEEHITHVF